MHCVRNHQNVTQTRSFYSIGNYAHAHAQGQARTAQQCLNSDLLLAGLTSGSDTFTSAGGSRLAAAVQGKQKSDAAWGACICFHLPHHNGSVQRPCHDTFRFVL